MTQDVKQVDIVFHYPPELTQLLINTIPLLCPAKRDVLTFFRGSVVRNSPAKPTTVVVDGHSARADVHVGGPVCETPASYPGSPQPDGATGGLWDCSREGEVCRKALPSQ
jgi:hypothetical protein